MRRVAAALATVVALVGGAPAAAHRVVPEDVMAQITEPASRARLGVLGAERDARLPRLLVVRVGERWLALDAALRRETAETWRERWRHAVTGGVLAVTDTGGRSLVSFDAAGRAQLRDPGAGPGAGTGGVDARAARPDHRRPARARAPEAPG